MKLIMECFLHIGFEVSVVLDNEAIYGICQKKLDIPRPDYADLNILISKTVSSMVCLLILTCSIIIFFLLNKNYSLDLGHSLL